jgi:hypothetical protein
MLQLEELIAHERQHTWLRATVHADLVRQALADRPTRQRRRRWRAWLGQRLIIWGERLQTGPAPRTAPAQPKR